MNEFGLLLLSIKLGTHYRVSFGVNLIIMHSWWPIKCTCYSNDDAKVFLEGVEG